MRHERGFSLVELMVAMTVTLIVSGAIYGLLTSGGNAFRREPEVADRQQNIRTAMDLISRDVFNAGAALPTFAQAFTRTDPAGGACVSGLNGCGVAGTMGAAAATARSGDAEQTDVLEIVSTDERCPPMTECCIAAGCAATARPNSAGNFVTREAVPQCMTLPGLAMLTTVTGNPVNDWFVIQPATTTTATPADCSPGGNVRNGNLTLGASLSAWPPAGTIATPPLSANPPPDTPVVFVYRGRIVRYRIAPSSDPTDSAPALWRSETGRYSTAGIVVTEPGAAGFALAGSPWQLVARGIEDLQIEYRDGTGVWQNQPPVSITGTWTTLVRQVRITLSARVSQANLGGESTAGGGGPNAVRGQLSTVVVPRAAFNELQMGNQIR
jgi:prepilin-type N-terminal cleavage/methylation domain-containing protein